MDPTLLLIIIVVLICVWYYCFIRAKGVSLMNYIFPPCEQVKIIVPAKTEEFRDDISSHMIFSEDGLKNNLYGR